MKTYKSKYVERFFYEEKQMVTSTWLTTTESMNAKEFKEEMQSLADMITEENVKFILSITKDLRFPIVPELQEWILEVIVPQFTDAKIEKQAMIVPEEFIAQLSMEQTVDDVELSKHTHESKFFTEVEEAQAWFFDNKQT
ncbi:hypothetical protein ACE193_01215 [Bernardetia sp. OM2101]|uniref:hypothetical protein n=1 Tax=Bernardetia sp. OM2101 TaxID=3344876 RepID=UPI0035D033AE